MHRFARYFMIWMLAVSLLVLPDMASAAPQKKEDPSLLIKEIMGLAYEDRQTLNSRPYGLDDSLTTVENDWGPPDDKGTVAANYYSRHVRFIYDGSTPAQTITAIDDWDPRLPTITLRLLKRTIGTPISEREQEGNYYVTYSDHDRYKVIFVFESKMNNPNPKLLLYQLYPGNE
jgi:hypothetical protein